MRQLKHSCAKKDCPNLVQPPDKYCKSHKSLEFPKQKLKDHEQNRLSSSDRGYDNRWVKARKYYLAKHPLCVICNDAATVVDHIIPHKGDKKLFWDSSNWQSLCRSCHSKKTIKELYDMAIRNNGNDNRYLPELPSQHEQQTSTTQTDTISSNNQSNQ